MSDKKNILVTVLNWGIGHAARSIPMIKELQKQHHVIIASDGAALAFLKHELVQSNFEELPSYNITYSASNNQLWHLTKQLPKILQTIKKEHEVVQRLITVHQINMVISDNRYGCYNSNITSVIITHQLQLKVPFAGRIVNKKLRNWLLKFDTIWIPDDSKNTFSGELSKHINLPVKHIGIQSRMTLTKAQKPLKINEAPFVLAVISGPEPQRAIFEGILIRSLVALKKNAVVVGGNSEQKPHQINQYISYIPQLNGQELKWYMKEATHIVCRSGYSTLMDLVALHRKALLIPTIGQIEQEYLAKLFSQRHGFKTISQDKLHAVSLKNYFNNAAIQIEKNYFAAPFDFQAAVLNILETKPSN